jgi:hypothetical protein
MAEKPRTKASKRVKLSNEIKKVLNCGNKNPSHLLIPIDEDFQMSFNDWEVDDKGNWVLIPKQSSTKNKHLLHLKLYQDGEVVHNSVINYDDIPNSGSKGSLLLWIINELSASGLIPEQDDIHSLGKEVPSSGIELGKKEEMMKMITYELKSGDGLVQVFDDKQNLIQSASSKEEALEKIKQKIQQGELQEGQNLEIIQFGQSNINLPVLYGTMIQIAKDLDMRKIDDRIKYYKLKDIVEKGFTSADMMDFAKEIINDKTNELQEDGVRKTIRTNKSVAYSLDDVKKLRQIGQRMIDSNY